jgi:hypothetical protein
VTEGSKTSSSQPPEETLSSDASTALQEIAELFSTVRWLGPCRKYVLERIDGELVFRQTEIDAVLEATLTALLDSDRTATGRCIIKLPSP